MRGLIPPARQPRFGRLRMRVLLIEDDEQVARSIELMLKAAGFNIFTTDLGEDGVDLGKVYEYDLIILDLGLPDISGYEVLKQLRMSRVNTPVLILSANPDIEAKVKNARLRRRRLSHQAVQQGRAYRPYHRDRAPLERPRRERDPHRRHHREPRCQDCRSEQQPRSPHRQRVPDVRASLPSQGDDAHQGNVPQPPLRWHGRTRN